MWQLSSGVGMGDCSETSLVNRCPSSSAILSAANYTFKASPRVWQGKSSSVPTPPPIRIGNLVTQEVSTGHHWPLPRVGAQGWMPSG